MSKGGRGGSGWDVDLKSGREAKLLTRGLNFFRHNYFLGLSFRLDVAKRLSLIGSSAIGTTL
jgi:hypothetical protein